MKKNANTVTTETLRAIRVSQPRTLQNFRPVIFKDNRRKKIDNAIRKEMRKIG